MGERWFIRLQVWAYNLGHGQEIDQSHAGPREQTLIVRAEDIGKALEMADLFRSGILTSPWVWQSHITEIRQAEHGEDARPFHADVLSVIKPGRPSTPSA